MLLHPDPSLAEVPGFSSEQLDALARSVELRRQQLEGDIKAYIESKAAELRSHEQELLQRHRLMDRSAEAASAATTPSSHEDDAVQLSPEPRERAPEEKAKQKKHSRVHKREKELYGLVTPVFLPLLDARDNPPAKKKEKPHARADAAAAAAAEQTGPSRDAEKSKESRKARKENRDMESATQTEPGKEHQHAEPIKKSKRAAIKKSSLRHNNTPRTRRKRVSLVIDGQTVLPADTVAEPPLTSPSSETTSPSNSTASLDEMIDPRLTRHDPPIPQIHHDAVHHSLPIPLSSAPLSPTKPLFETPSSMTLDPVPSPPLASPSIPFSPTARTSFLDPSPSRALLPTTAGADPAGPPTSFDDDELAEDNHWDTYVGGLHGSGTDDVDQAGSYGYPSSLGASYLESYMQSRPLSVRMQAATKAGLQGAEKDKMTAAEEEKKPEEVDDVDFGVDIDVGRVRDVDDDMDIVGSMEDF